MISHPSQHWSPRGSHPSQHWSPFLESPRLHSWRSAVWAIWADALVQGFSRGRGSSNRPGEGSLWEVRVVTYGRPGPRRWRPPATRSSKERYCRGRRASLLGQSAPLRPSRALTQAHWPPALLPCAIRRAWRPRSSRRRCSPSWIPKAGCMRCHGSSSGRGARRWAYLGQII